MTDLKTYVVQSDTNYGLMVLIVNAYTPEEAVEIAENDEAWEGSEAYEIDTKSRGIVHRSG